MAVAVSSARPIASRGVAQAQLALAPAAWGRLGKARSRGLCLDELLPQCRRCMTSSRTEPKLLVLAHGFWGGRRIHWTPFDYWRGIVVDLESAGYEVLVAEVPPTSTVAERADSLAEQIASWDKRAGRPVAVLGHSMGGLDVRYAISKLGAGSMIHTCMTVASPHRGSSVADLLMRQADRFELSRLVEELPIKFLADMPGGARCLTVEASEEFNRQVLDVDGVRYLSMGGSRGSVLRTSPELAAFYLYLENREGPNDGLVSVKSATWGEYVATLDMDHFHQVNFPLPHRWLSGAPSYQDVVASYRWVADLATSPLPERSGEPA